MITYNWLIGENSLFCIKVDEVTYFDSCKIDIISWKELNNATIILTMILPQSSIYLFEDPLVLEVKRFTVGDRSRYDLGEKILRIFDCKVIKKRVQNIVSYNPDDQDLVKLTLRIKCSLNWYTND